MALENGSIVRVPVQLVDVKDSGNVRCLVGKRTVLLDGAFLAEAEVVAAAPVAQKPQLDALAEALAALQARLDALETAPAGGSRKKQD
jgi:hypothetical protein